MLDIPTEIRLGPFHLRVCCFCICLLWGFAGSRQGESPRDTPPHSLSHSRSLPLPLRDHRMQFTSHSYIVCVCLPQNRPHMPHMPPTDTRNTNTAATTTTTHTRTITRNSIHSRNSGPHRRKDKPPARSVVRFNYLLHSPTPQIACLRWMTF